VNNLTSLQFRYDGYKRPERRSEVCFFPPRYNFPGYGADMFEKDTAKVEKAVETEKDFLERKEQVEVEKDSLELKEQVEVEREEKKEKEEVKNFDVSQVSEMLIKNLTTTEAKLTEVKGQVNFAKMFFDDLIFKLESFLQIVEIVKANEKRRLSEPQAQLASLKTSQDSVDEFLELLQGPVFQNILRQFLISVMAREGNVTKFGDRT
jgi:hypothetical protein